MKYDFGIGKHLVNWSLAFSRLCPDLAIPGSPERCILRYVVEDASGSLWLLEQLEPGQAARREAMGLLLESLAERGLYGLAPYRRTFGTGDGSFVCRDGGHSWQLSPFIQGEPLVQPDYLDESAKGGSLGAWMAALREASLGLAAPPGLFELDLPAYIADLLDRIDRASQKPDRKSLDLAQVHSRASRLLPALTAFFEAYPSLPRSLCHGDTHPLNVVWGESGLLAVIDWEFAGIRPALYDLANCLGCAGIEGDSAFDSPFTRALLSQARAQEFLTGDQAPWLPAMILATRFGWLSEWLRRGDEEMLGLELSYMEQLAGLPGRNVFPGA